MALNKLERNFIAIGVVVVYGYMLLNLDKIIGKTRSEPWLLVVIIVLAFMMAKLERR